MELRRIKCKHLWHSLCHPLRGTGRREGVCQDVLSLLCVCYQEIFIWWWCVKVLANIERVEEDEEEGENHLEKALQVFLSKE